MLERGSHVKIPSPAPRFRQQQHIIWMRLLSAPIAIWKMLAFPFQGHRLVQTNTFLATLLSAGSGMCQTKSPENGFILHVNILGDGVVFSGFVFLFCFSKYLSHSGLFGFVWFRKTGREFRKRVSFLGPASSPDTEAVIRCFLSCP